LISNKTTKKIFEFRVPQILKLKVGAQVVLLKNLNLSLGLCNGSRGVVVDFQKNKENTSDLNEYPLVLFKKNGFQQLITPKTWSIESANIVLATRTNVPLGLAYSMSIHKSQGMTIDDLVVDLTNCFDCGMMYVALSRAKSLDSIKILGFDPNGAMACSRVIKFYSDLQKNDKKNK